MVNLSLFDSEVWCKVRTKVGEEIFSDNGFYGNKSPWILQAQTKANGHFRLGNLENSKGVKLKELRKEEGLPSIKLYIQIKYRDLGGKFWKKSPVQRYYYDFESDNFWLDV